MGIPKVGKSSLMQEILDTKSEELWTKKRFLVVWYTFKKSTNSVDVDKRSVFLNLVNRVYHFLKKHNENVLLDVLEEYYTIIKDTSVVWAEFEQNVLYFLEELVFSGIRVIYCIDEFDHSKDVLCESEYELLREISYRNSNKIAIVTTSRRSIYDIEHYSGGGSNFYGTFENIFLKPFSWEEHVMQCGLMPSLSELEVDELFQLHGGHPYLNALILNQYALCNSITKSSKIVNQTILQYYEDLFYVLDKDDLADKVDKLYCGFIDGVSETQEDYILNCYGIFKEDAEGFKIPYSIMFENVLNQRYRKNPFSLVWPQAENAIRQSITYAMSEEYGNDNMDLWIDEIRYFPKVKSERFDQWLRQMKIEKNIYQERASTNIIDQFYPNDYIIFFEIFWLRYLHDIYKQSLQYWTESLKFIANKIRNPEMHSRRNLIAKEELQKATIICVEIIDCVRKAGI